MSLTARDIRVALYRDERAAMKAAAHQGHLTQINSLLIFIANHDPEAVTVRAETQPNNHRCAPSDKPWAGMFDSPFRPATYSK